MASPAVLTGPTVRAHMLRGFTVVTRAVAATLGPSQGGVLSAVRSDVPEILVDSATVARRIVALPDRRADVGAMLARNLVWRQHQSVGDGCATALVLAHAMLLRAHRYAEAGVHVAALRAGMAAGAEAAASALLAMARPAQGEAELAGVAYTASGEQRVSALLGEIFDILGPDASVTVEELVAPYLDREYHHGGQWRAFLASPYLMTSQEERVAVLSDAAVALFNGDVASLDDIRPLLEAAAGQQPPRLLLVANNIASDALAALVFNHQRGSLRAVAATMRRPGELGRFDYADLAALTGARVLDPAAGDRLGAIRPEDLGRAERVKAGATSLTVANRRDGEVLRAYVAALRAQIASGVARDEFERAEFRQRIGRLSGGVATLKVGAATKAEATLLKARAEQGIGALSGALRGGVVPGGGVALLACAAAAEAARPAGDSGYGAAAVAAALEAPMRRIVANAGLREPDEVLAEVRRAGAGFGYDAAAGEVAHMERAGVLDSAGVLAAALRAAASAAAMVLTTDAVVLKRDPELSTEP